MPHALICVYGSFGRQVSNRVCSLMAVLRNKYPRLKNAPQLRASAIVKWLKQYNLRQLQHMAGNRYISSTESYLQKAMEGLLEEIQQYHPLG